MQKIGLLFLALNGTGGTLLAQSSSQNYILTQTYKTATTTRSGNINVASQQVAYFDGLGRPLQEVAVFASPVVTNNKPADLVSHTEYDAYGRVSKVYLPYPHTDGNANYQPGAAGSANNYYNNSGNFSNPNSRGYTLTEYESSPLNRITKQYAGGTDRAIEYTYGVNGDNEVKLYTVSGSTPGAGTSYYGSGQLSYVETKDENGSRSREYKDKQGQVILRRTYKDKNNNSSNLDTYYVYDDLGRIRFVLQPTYQDNAVAGRYFYYEYNDRGLIAKKMVPGAGTTELTYNDRDLLAESKDANGKITYYKYDGLNRVIETGEKQGTSELPLTRTYYDNYPLEATGFKADVGSGYPTSRRSNVKGMLTAEAVRILNPDGSYGSEWKYTATYYNDRLQVIQITRQLFDLGSGAVEYTAMSLRYDGRVEKEVVIQQVGTGTNSLETIYSYDHADRVLSLRHIVKKEGTTKLDFWSSATRYDGIGLVKNKYLHSTDGGNYRQRLTHSFTPRSWLKKVEGQTSAGANFGVELKYTDPGAGALAQYNGNIAEMLWRRGGSWVGYKFSYDDLNRLTSTEGISNGYREYDINYDKNGNLQSLKRHDGSVEWDNLTYINTDNRLMSVIDGSGNNNGVKNGTSSYGYDNAGNLTSDGNRGAQIAYNLLNLPRQVLVNGQTVQYHYDGSGNKVRMSNTNGTVNTKYAGQFEYNENTYLARIGLAEGQIAVTDNGNTYTAHYYLKDHLGNVRTVINGAGTILQETEYFPFGLSIPRSGTDALNKYQYNGKEKQPETGYLDYGARMYDPTIGRWMVVDPLSNLFEDLSGYVYAVNNPLRYVDHDGMFASDTVAKSIELKEVVVIGTKRPDKPTTATQKLVSLEGWVPYLSEYRDYKFDKFEGTFPQYLGDIHRQTPRPSTYHGGTPPGLIGFTKLSPADLLKVARVMKTLIRKGRAPSQIKRIDTPVTDPSGKVLHGEQVHIHLQDGRALRADGTWKHGEGEVPKKVVEWIDDLIKELK